LNIQYFEHYLALAFTS